MFLFIRFYIFLIPVFTGPINSLQILSVFHGRDNHTIYRTGAFVRLCLFTGSQREDGKAVFSADSALLHKPEGVGVPEEFLLTLYHKEYFEYSRARLTAAHPRAKMSVRDVLAHEFYGHRPNRAQYLWELENNIPFDPAEEKQAYGNLESLLKGLEKYEKDWMKRMRI